MEANELRIGNLVEYLGEFKEVLGMDEETVFLKNTVSVNYLDLDEISPILLTKEWLLNFGFDKIGVNFDFKNFVLWGNCLDSKVSFRLLDNEKIEIKHVHQLQNLYFALTNNELIFKS